MSNYFKSSKIRDTFINYFHNNSHKILDSSSIAPENDNTILFTNAGMVQFKKWFTGEVKPKYKNVATVQSEINDERANENEDLNCTGDVYYGRKYTDSNETDIASYNDLIKDNYFV